MEISRNLGDLEIDHLRIIDLVILCGCFLFLYVFVQFLFGVFALRRDTGQARLASDPR